MNYKTMATPKIFNQLLICINLYQHAKNQLIASVHWDTVNFRVQRTDWPHSFLFMPKHKISNQHLLFVNFYQHAKNEAVIDLFWKNSWCKNPTSDWLRAFWPISQEEHFSLTQDFCRNKANSINFHYRKLSVKINDPIFLYIQKTLFLAHFPNVWNKKKFFPTNSDSAT